MKIEETKDNGTEGRYAAFGCCNPEDFRKMFEAKCRCFCDQGDATDFSAMKEGMMKKMMEMWCGDRAEETNTKPKKEPEEKTDSTSDEYCSELSDENRTKLSGYLADFVFE